MEGSSITHIRDADEAESKLGPILSAYVRIHTYVHIKTCLLWDRHVNIRGAGLVFLHVQIKVIPLGAESGHFTCQSQILLAARIAISIIEIEAPGFRVGNGGMMKLWRAYNLNFDRIMSCWCPSADRLTTGKRNF